MSKLSEDANTRLTIAALAAIMVRAIDSSLPGFASNVVNELRDLRREMRHWDSEPIGALESLRWAQELVERH